MSVIGAVDFRLRNQFGGGFGVKIKCKGKTTPGLKKPAARVSFNSSVVRFINKVVHSLKKSVLIPKLSIILRQIKDIRCCT